MVRTVEAATHIKAPRSLVFSILTTYEHYENWMPDVTSARLLAREGSVAIAELIAPPFGRGKLILEFVESAPDWITWHQTDQLRQHGLSGRWDLEEADGGGGVVVRGRLDHRAGLFAPTRRRVMHRVLERTLSALSSRVLRLAAAGAGAEPLARRKLLEIEPVDGGLEIRLEDAVYFLTPKPGDARP